MLSKGDTNIDVDLHKDFSEKKKTYNLIHKFKGPHQLKYSLLSISLPDPSSSLTTVLLISPLSGVIPPQIPI